MATKRSARITRPAGRVSRRRAASRIAKASTSELRKLSPAENVRAGRSAKAERYVLCGKRVTRTTTTISKRQYLQKQTAEHAGEQLSLEQAARRRREQTLSYRSAVSEDQAAKQRETRALQRASRLKSVRDLKGMSYRPGMLGEFEELRRRKLAGEDLPDTDWFEMMDIANAIDDPRLSDLRRSAYVRPTHGRRAV
jgi:hypothetical protein